MKARWVFVFHSETLLIKSSYVPLHLLDVWMYAMYTMFYASWESPEKSLSPTLNKQLSVAARLHSFSGPHQSVNQSDICKRWQCNDWPSLQLDFFDEPVWVGGGAAALTQPQPPSMPRTSLWKHYISLFQCILLQRLNLKTQM